MLHACKLHHHGDRVLFDINLPVVAELLKNLCFSATHVRGTPLTTPIVWRTMESPVVRDDTKHTIFVEEILRHQVLCQSVRLASDNDQADLTNDHRRSKLRSALD